MKLRNKQTGEISKAEARDDGIYLYNEVTEEWYKYELSLLAKGWEYYEEPKGSALDLMILTLTNFIENEPDEDKVDLEDCEQMLEKLKAWKRLKDKGFRFEGIKQDYTRFFSQQKPIRIGRKYLQFNKAEDEEWLKENGEDLDLLFNEQEYIRKKAQKIVEDNADYYDKFGGKE